MLLKELLIGFPVKEWIGSRDREISGIAYSSKDVRPAFLFCAMRGWKTDGHRFIGEAVASGAVAVLGEDASQFSKSWLDRATFIRTENARSLFAELASRFYGEPSRRVGVVGITGTNGKTTTAFLIRSLMETLGPTGLIGTVGNWIGKEKRPARHTTPESSDLQSLFREMENRGVRNIVMEVSSHALALDRVRGTCFDTVVFTNLTQDHLDFHNDMESYFKAKSLLFSEMAYAGERGKRPLGLINADDPWGERLKSIAGGEIWTYALENRADIRAEDLRMDDSGTRLVLKTPAGNLKIRSPLLGKFNVYNLMAAAGAALRHGIPISAIEEALEKTGQVPGRLERVPGNYPFSVFIDYAHTDDALRKILETLNALKRGRLIVLFGCGGDRDRGKRPKMGRAASELADLLILTSDNPRSEDPEAILNEIETGVLPFAGGRKTVWKRIADRREAIQAAIEEARTGDIVLIAGKGHEEVQILGNRTIEFSDREVSAAFLRERFGA